MKIKNLNETQLEVLAISSNQKRIALSAAKKLSRLETSTKETLLNVFTCTKHSDVKAFLQVKLLALPSLRLQDFKTLSSYDGSPDAYVKGLNEILLRKDVGEVMLFCLSVNNVDSNVAVSALRKLVAMDFIKTEIFYNISIGSQFEEVAILAIQRLFQTSTPSQASFFRLLRSVKYENLWRVIINLYICKDDSDITVLRSLSLPVDESYSEFSFNAVKAIAKKKTVGDDVLVKIANEAKDGAVSLIAIKDLIRREPKNEKSILDVAYRSIHEQIIIFAQEYLSCMDESSILCLSYLSQYGMTDEIATSAYNNLSKKEPVDYYIYSCLSGVGKTKEIRLAALKIFLSDEFISPGDLLEVYRSIDEGDIPVILLTSDKLFSVIKNKNISEDFVCEVIECSERLDLLSEAFELLISKYGLSDYSLKYFSTKSKTLRCYIASNFLTPENLWHAVYTAI